MYYSENKIKKYVIIGAGAAGVNAARTLRTLDSEAKIVLLSEETVLPYNKCLLTKVLAGKAARDTVFLHDEAFYTEQKIELVLGCTITTIDREKHIICYSVNGQEIKCDYTKLLIATGAKAVEIYPTHNRIHNFHTLRDLDTITTLLQKDSVVSCVIIGAGITGLECADALRIVGLNVTLITTKFLPSFGLNSMVQHECAELVQASGVTIYQSAIKSCTATSKNVILELEDSTKITVDFVLVTCGVKQNIEFLSDCNLLSVSKKLIVNKYLQTADPALYAAGDCAVIVENTIERKQQFLWADAVAQGITAAKNMTGDTQEYIFEGALTITSFAKMPLVMYGVTNNSNLQLRAIEEKTINGCTVYYCEGNGIVRGFVSYNMVQFAMHSRKMIGHLVNKM